MTEIFQSSRETQIEVKFKIINWNALDEDGRKYVILLTGA
jgi:hypothetical protein